MRISDWSSDVCSSDLVHIPLNNQSSAACPNVLLGLVKPKQHILLAENKGLGGVQIFGWDKALVSIIGLPILFFGLLKAPTSKSYDLPIHIAQAKKNPISENIIKRTGAFGLLHKARVLEPPVCPVVGECTC